MNNTSFTTIQQSWTPQNLTSDPTFIAPAAGNYNIDETSAAIDMSTQSYANAAPDVQQQFIDHYDNPNDPRNYWPQDHLG